MSRCHAGVAGSSPVHTARIVKESGTVRSRFFSPAREGLGRSRSALHWGQPLRRHRRKLTPVKSSRREKERHSAPSRLAREDGIRSGRRSAFALNRRHEHYGDLHDRRSRFAFPHARGRSLRPSRPRSRGRAGGLRLGAQQAGRVRGACGHRRRCRSDGAPDPGHHRQAQADEGVGDRRQQVAAAPAPRASSRSRRRRAIRTRSSSPCPTCSPRRWRPACPSTGRT